MWRLVVLVGGLLWMLTIGASGVMNAVAGYSLGRTEVEGYIFAAIGIVADGLKSLVPIVIASLVREKKHVPAILGSLMWVGCFVVAVTAAIGLAAQNRSATTGGREAISAAYGVVTRELEVLYAKTAGVSSHRPVAQIEAAIAAVLARPVAGTGTVGMVSKQCIADTGRTRAACAEIADLRVELAAAVDDDRMAARRAELEREQQRLSRLGGAANPDPQAELLSRMLRGLISIQDAGLGLVLVLVTTVELVSAFTPVVLTEYARGERARASSRGTRSRSANSQAIELRPVGDVFEYMADCIRPAPGGSVPVAAVVLSYQQWCAARGRAPLAAKVFLQEFDRICREELQGRVRKDRSEIRDISLVEAIAAPELSGR